MVFIFPFRYCNSFWINLIWNTYDTQVSFVVVEKDVHIYKANARIAPLAYGPMLINLVHKNWMVDHSSFNGTLQEKEIRRLHCLFMNMSIIHLLISRNWLMDRKWNDFLFKTIQPNGIGLLRNWLLTILETAKHGTEESQNQVATRPGITNPFSGEKVASKIIKSPRISPHPLRRHNQPMPLPISEASINYIPSPSPPRSQLIWKPNSEQTLRKLEDQISFYSATPGKER